MREGAVYFSGEDLTAAAFTVDVGSLSVEDMPADAPDNVKLKTHLLSADFFDAENFPTAIFELTAASVYVAETADAGTTDSADGTGTETAASTDDASSGAVRKPR